MLYSVLVLCALFVGTSGIHWYSDQPPRASIGRIPVILWEKQQADLRPYRHEPPPQHLYDHHKNEGTMKETDNFPDTNSETLVRRLKKHSPYSWPEVYNQILSQTRRGNLPQLKALRLNFPSRLELRGHHVDILPKQVLIKKPKVNLYDILKNKCIQTNVLNKNMSLLYKEITEPTSHVNPVSTRMFDYPLLTTTDRNRDKNTTYLSSGLAGFPYNVASQTNERNNKLLKIRPFKIFESKYEVDQMFKSILSDINRALESLEILRDYQMRIIKEHPLSVHEENNFESNRPTLEISEQHEIVKSSIHNQDLPRTTTMEEYTTRNFEYKDFQPEILTAANTIRQEIITRKYEITTEPTENTSVSKYEEKLEDSHSFFSNFQPMLVETWAKIVGKISPQKFSNISDNISQDIPMSKTNTEIDIPYQKEKIEYEFKESSKGFIVKTELTPSETSTSSVLLDNTFNNNNSKSLVQTISEAEKNEIVLTDYAASATTELYPVNYELSRTEKMAVNDWGSSYEELVTDSENWDEDFEEIEQINAKFIPKMNLKTQKEKNLDENLESYEDTSEINDKDDWEENSQENGDNVLAQINMSTLKQLFLERLHEELDDKALKTAWKKFKDAFIKGLEKLRTTDRPIPVTHLFYSATLSDKTKESKINEQKSSLDSPRTESHQESTKEDLKILTTFLEHEEKPNRKIKDDFSEKNTESELLSKSVLLGFQNTISDKTKESKINEQKSSLDSPQTESNQESTKEDLKILTTFLENEEKPNRILKDNFSEKSTESQLLTKSVLLDFQNESDTITHKFDVGLDESYDDDSLKALWDSFVSENKYLFDNINYGTATINTINSTPSGELTTTLNNNLDSFPTEISLQSNNKFASTESSLVPVYKELTNLNSKLETTTVSAKLHSTSVGGSLTDYFKDDATILTTIVESNTHNSVKKKSEDYFPNIITLRETVTKNFKDEAQLITSLDSETKDLMSALITNALKYSDINEIKSSTHTKQQENTQRTNSESNKFLNDSLLNNILSHLDLTLKNLSRTYVRKESHPMNALLSSISTLITTVKNSTQSLKHTSNYTIKSESHTTERITLLTEPSEPFDYNQSDYNYIRSTNLDQSSAGKLNKEIFYSKPSDFPSSMNMVNLNKTAAPSESKSSISVLDTIQPPGLTSNAPQPNNSIGIPPEVFESITQQLYADNFEDLTATEINTIKLLWASYFQNSMKARRVIYEALALVITDPSLTIFKFNSKINVSMEAVQKSMDFITRYLLVYEDYSAAGKLLSSISSSFNESDIPLGVIFLEVANRVMVSFILKENKFLKLAAKHNINHLSRSIGKLVFGVGSALCGPRNLSNYLGISTVEKGDLQTIIEALKKSYDNRGMLFRGFVNVILEGFIPGNFCEGNETCKTGGEINLDELLDNNADSILHKLQNFVDILDDNNKVVLKIEKLAKRLNTEISVLNFINSIFMSPRILVGFYEVEFSTRVVNSLYKVLSAISAKVLGQIQINIPKWFESEFKL